MALQICIFPLPSGLGNYWDAFEKTPSSQEQGAVLREGGNGMSWVPSLLPSPNPSWILGNPTRGNRDRPNPVILRNGTEHLVGV